jgi:hypothetical protein
MASQFRRTKQSLINTAQSKRLFRLVTELRYPAIKLPEFHVMTIDELFGVFLGGVVIGTNKLYRSDEVAVRANDERSVLCHRISLPP